MLIVDWRERRESLEKLLDIRHVWAEHLTGVGHQIVVSQTDSLGGPSGSTGVRHGHHIMVRIKLLLWVAVQGPVISQHQTHKVLATIRGLVQAGQHDRLLYLGGLQVGGGLLGLL